MRNCAFISAIVVALFSCVRSKDTLDIITNGKYKYWLVLKDSKDKSQSKNYYYFDTNGNWFVFIEYENGTFEKYDGGDVVLIETWKLINDSTVDIGTRPYHIKKIDQEEFIFDYKEEYQKKLVAAPDSLIPTKFQRMQ